MLKVKSFNTKSHGKKQLYTVQLEQLEHFLLRNLTNFLKLHYLKTY